MVKRIGLLYRAFGAAVVAVSLLAFAPGSALAAQKDVHGTIIAANDEKEEWVILTSSLTGKEQPITVDMSRMSDTYARHKRGEPIHIIVEERQNDTYRGVGFVASGSYVEGENLGVQERYETQESSIKAHVANVPEDDEALNQQHRQNDLKRKEEEAKGSENGSK